MTAPVQIPYLESPAVLVNEALDLIGASEETILGDINDGTRVGEAARRIYGQALRQLLRTAQWDFARKQACLTLLGTNTLPAASLPPGVSPFVEQPWAYAYEWPIDAIYGRWMLWSPTNGVPDDTNGIPETTGASSPLWYGMIPGRFLVAPATSILSLADTRLGTRCRTCNARKASGRSTARSS